MGVFIDKLWATANDSAQLGAFQFLEAHPNPNKSDTEHRRMLLNEIDRRLEKQRVRITDEARYSLVRRCPLNEVREAFHSSCRMCGWAASKSVFGVGTIVK
jgi:hypothetical protein